MSSPVRHILSGQAQAEEAAGDASDRGGAERAGARGVRGREQLLRQRARRWPRRLPAEDVRHARRAEQAADAADRSGEDALGAAGGVPSARNAEDVHELMEHHLELHRKQWRAAKHGRAECVFPRFFRFFSPSSEEVLMKQQPSAEVASRARSQGKMTLSLIKMMSPVLISFEVIS